MNPDACSSSASSVVSGHASEISFSNATLKEQQQHIVNLLKGQTYTIPYLCKCLPGWYLGVNPNYERVRDEQDAFVDEWIEKEGLREMAKKVNLSHCIACLFPKASAEKFQVLFEKMAWFFAFDDDADNFLKADEFANQHVIEFLKYWMDLNRTGPEPVVYQSCHIYRSCGPKLAMGFSETAKEQFLETTIEYVNCLLSVSKKRETYLPPVEEYIEERIVNIGVYPTMDLIPFVSGLEISREIMQHKAMRTIRYHIVRIVTLTNDLFSVKKEIKDGQYDNIVPLLMTCKGMTLQEAVDYTVELVEESYHAVDDSEKQLPALEGKEKEDLAEYVEQLRWQATGSVLWHELSERYLKRDAFDETKITVHL
ncbi:hypothetical protein FQN51_007414 [Onygenales sp. PD_10]|nr:hypothetical protein FQN51_007414 [Onygenales sp. PD_10]